MQLFVLLEPKELTIDPLGTLVVPQFFLLLLVKLDIIEFNLIQFNLIEFNLIE